MKTYSDNPGCLSLPVPEPSGPVWQAVDAPGWLGPLLPGQFETARQVWSTQDADSDGFWSHGVIIEKAPGSQYDALRTLTGANSREAGNVACLALGGRRFHGQHGRPWQTLAGNFHWSARVGLDLPAETCGRALVALPALAVLDILDPLGPGHPVLGIKWVNDILWRERKIAGVLTAARTQGGRLESVVFGVGINVAATPTLETSPFSPWATSLSEQLVDGGADGVPERVPDIGEFFIRMNQAVARRIIQLHQEGPAGLLEQYRRRSLVLGRRVGIWPPGDDVPGPAGAPLHRGRVLEVLPDLSLRLEGVSEPLVTGRLVLLPESGDSAE